MQVPFHTKRLEILMRRSTTAHKMSKHRFALSTELRSLYHSHRKAPRYGRTWCRIECARSRPVIWIHVHTGTPTSDTQDTTVGLDVPKLRSDYLRRSAHSTAPQPINFTQHIHGNQRQRQASRIIDTGSQTKHRLIGL